MSPRSRRNYLRRAVRGALSFALCAGPWATPAALAEGAPATAAATADERTDDPLAAIEAARAELRALADLLDPARDLAAPLPGIAVDTPAPVVTSEVPPAPSSGDVATPPSEPWLRDLVLPDFEVRWDEDLIELLRYYREDERGRAHIRGWLQRAGRYEAMVRRVMRDAGLPEDLLYVAMVESGFDPTAASGAGAVGMWQFVKPTADDYGLERSKWLDERLSPEASTRAAARFFADLYGRLGSWPLALAAYNMGYGAMLRSIRKYNSNDFLHLARLEAGLPYESIAYVHKVAACAIVAHNLERFEMDVQPDPPSGTVAVEVPGGVGMGRLARAAGMGTEELAALNPELLKSRVPPDVESWSLRVPGDRAERFRARWSELQQGLRPHALHVMRFGERLEDLAEMYDTTTAKLRALNGLERDSDARPGTPLRVPDVEVTPPPAPTDVVAAVPDRRFEYADRQHVFYRVVPGDRLSELASFFQVSMDELRRWNDIDTDALLHSGMVLQLFVPKEVDLSRALVLRPGQVQQLVVGSDAFFDHHESEQGRMRIRYRVKAGDTLESLASRFELSVGSIARINRFSRYTTLRPDSEIVLYVPDE